MARIDAAQTTSENRNHWLMADGLSARAAYNPSIRKTLRDRSRYEASSNSWYAGLLRTVVNHVIGTGPRLQVMTPDKAANARLERAWSQWAKSAQLTEKLRIAVETYWRDGEVFFLRSSHKARWPVSTDIRIYEADQVAAPWSGGHYDADVEDGIRIDDDGCPIEFHIFKHHPGDATYHDTMDGEWYPAADVRQLFRCDRPGQIRGIPRLTPSLPLFAILRRHALATLFAAESAANHAMVMTSTSAASTVKKSNADFGEFEIARNMMTVLPEGWSMQQIKPEHPTTNHEMYLRATLMEIGRCSGLPYSLVAGTSKDSNFSSVKMDVRNTWGPEVITEQERITGVAVEAAWLWFLEDAFFVAGLLDGLPPIGEIDHHFQWDPLPTTDEIDDVNAGKARLDSRVSTVTLEYQRRGLDFEASIAREAQAFGVSPEQHKATVYLSIYGQAPGAVPAALPVPTPGMATDPAAAVAPAAAGGEFGALSRRQLTNNVKAVRDVLNQLIAGDISQVMAGQLLQTLGITADRADLLIADALDNAQIDDPEMAAAAAVTIEAKPARGFIGRAIERIKRRVFA